MNPSLGSQTLVHEWPRSGHSPFASPVPLPTVPALTQRVLFLLAGAAGCTKHECSHNCPLGILCSGHTPVYNCQISPFQAECSVSATIKCFSNCPLRSSTWSNFFFFFSWGSLKLLIRDSVFLLLASLHQLKTTTHWNWGITASGLQDGP